MVFRFEMIEYQRVLLARIVTTPLTVLCGEARDQLCPTNYARIVTTIAHP